MSLTSVLFTDLLWIAAAIGIMSLLARRFNWRNPTVYSLMIASVVELAFDFVTGAYFIGTLIWLVVAIGSYVWLVKDGTRSRRS